MDTPPQVFISYSHDSAEHLDRVLALANRLRKDGVEARLDQYEEAPAEGWRRWMLDQIEQADFVLVVASPVYRTRSEGIDEPGHGLGVAWEGAIVTQSLYEASSHNERFIPVVFSRDDVESIPIQLGGATYYDLSRGQGFEGLFRRLMGQSKIRKPDLGPLRHLAPLERRSSPSKPIAWTVPHQRDSGFVGRGQLLDKLIAVCERGNDERVHTLTGPGGIGKTAILVELAYRVRSAFQAILWLGADDADHLQTDMAKAALALKLPVPRSASSSRIGGSLLAWLRGNDRWIVVCDDVEDFGRIADFSFALGGRGPILAASRSSPPRSPRFRVYPVGPLPLDASLSILTSQEQPQDSIERKAATLLARELGGMPLAIKIVAAGIGTVHPVIGMFTAYLERFLAIARELKDEPLPVGRSDEVASVLRAGLGQLDGRDLKVLQVASCFAPGTAIPLPLLAEALEDLSAAELGATLDKLASSGWLRFDKEDGQFLGHPLALVFLRDKRWDPVVAAAAENALVAVATQANVDGKASQDLIRHLRFVVDGDRIRHDLRLSRLAYTLAEQLRLAGQAPEAETYLKRALEVREGKGRRDLKTARILARLAEAASARGDLQAADDYASRAGAIHPDAAAGVEISGELERRRVTGIDDFCGLVPWGEEMLAGLRQDGAAVSELRTVGAGRWLIQVKIPRDLQEAYGTAPQVLLLAVQGEAQGADLRRAQEELERYRFELDLDLLVVTDERPKLFQRLDLMYQTEGQWVPWSGEGRGFPSLAAAFRQSLPGQDIFAQRDAVRGRQIIGRGEDIATLSRSIRRGRTAGIYGLRKVGKTTVARAVTDRLDPISALLSLPRRSRGAVELSESSIRVAWLDAGRFFERTVEAVANRLLKALNDRLDAESLEVAAPEHGGGLGALDIRIEEILKASGTPLVFVIDEFDLLFEGSSGQLPVAGIEQLFQLLRAHAQETGRLVLVLIGRDPSFLEAPEMGGRTNPMLDWLVPRWLGPMEPKDADLLLEKLGRRVGLHIGAKTRRLARRWTGGHPRLHREFGSALLKVARETEVGRSRFLAGHVHSDDFRDQACEQFLERHGVLTICREVLHLLGEKYPAVAELLGELAGVEGEQRGRLLVSCGGWQRPENRILRDFGLVQGTLQRPEIPRFLIWYLQTFEPELRRRA